MRRNSACRIAVLTLAAVALLGVASGSAFALTLRLNLKQGQTYPLRMLMNEKMSQTMGEQSMDMNMIIGFGLSYTVDKVEPDGAMDLSVVYSWTRMKQEMSMGGQTMPMGGMDYDSARPATANQQTQMFAALVGLGFKMTVNPDGTVKDVTGLAEMRKQLIDKMNLPPGVMGERMKASIEKQYSEQGIKDNFSQMLPQLPKQGVSVGESWETTIEWPMMGKGATAKATYTLKAVNRGVATIGVVYTFEAKDAAATETDKTDSAISLTGKVEGTSDVDVKTGWLVGGHARMNLSGSMSMGQGPAMPMTMTGDITLQPPAETK